MIATTPGKIRYTLGKVSGRVPKNKSFKSFIGGFHLEHCLSASGNFINPLFAAVMCFAVLILTVFTYNEDYSTSLYTLTDELCSEWNGDDDNKGPMQRIDGSIDHGIQCIENQTSVFLSLSSFYKPFQTFLFFSLPAGRSPPC